MKSLRIGIGIGIWIGIWIGLGLGFVESAHAGCRIPWGVVKTDQERCAARLREGAWGFLCLSRTQFDEWLHQESPRCWPEQHGTPQRIFRVPMLDQQGSKIFESWNAQGSSGQWKAPVRWVDRLLLRGLQLVERQRDGFSRAVASTDTSGWLRGWVVGERVKNSKAVLSAPLLFGLGFVHLLTTAGVHLLFLDRILRRARAPGLMIWMVFAWVWLLSGMRWGMLRPLFLVALTQGFRRTGVMLRAPVPLLIAVGLEALLSALGWAITPDPDSAAHGRWHYLAAVWGGAWGAKNLEMSVGSWLWVLPLQVLHDGSLSLMNPILSLITIPVAGAVLLPLSLLSVIFTGLAPGVGMLSEWLLTLWIPLSKFDGANWAVHPIWLIPALLSAFAVWSRGLRGAWVAGVFCVLGLGVPACSEQSRTTVIQLDVGQGDSALVKTVKGGGGGILGFRESQSVGLVDVGPGRGLNGSAWFSLFSRHRISQLDWVVLTHLDEDHAGGLLRLASWIPIQCVVLPPQSWPSPRADRIRQAARRYGFQVQPYAEGCFPFQWAALRGGGDSANSGMVGVRIPLGEHRSVGAYYLNFGDAGTRGASREQELLDGLRPPEGSRVVLKLSHHGSRHSSSPEFLKGVGPSLVWISAGFGNRYGHPHPEVLGRLQDLKIEWQGTWQDGGIFFR
ncbi:MAG: ComEC/Rec2 family competence protein [Oligoflexia bacterium]